MIYAAKIDFSIESKRYQQLIPKISKRRAERLNSLVKENDKIRSVLAEVLLREALTEHYGIESSQISIDVDSMGKPYLKGIDNLYFNLSHSGNWVVCAIDCGPVGVDVEQIVEINLDSMEYFCTPDENAYVTSGINRDGGYLRFFQIWTLKESLVKAVGRGLSINLRKNNLIKGQELKKISTMANQEWCISSIILAGGYILSIAHKLHDFDDLKVQYVRTDGYY